MAGREGHDHGERFVATTSRFGVDCEVGGVKRLRYGADAGGVDASGVVGALSGGRAVGVGFYAGG